jgi:TfoX/Sxy family transcriptional regulator of competence genes
MKIARPEPDAIALLHKLTPTDDPRVAVKLVFGNPAAFVQGNMFMGVYGSELFFRLSPELLTEAGKIPGAGPFEPMKGHAMTGYVILPSSVLTDSKKAKLWVHRALEFSATLPKKERKARAK